MTRVRSKEGTASEVSWDENTKLSRMLADAMLDNFALNDLLAKIGDAHRRSVGLL